MRLSPYLVPLPDGCPCFEVSVYETGMTFLKESDSKLSNVFLKAATAKQCEQNLKIV